MNTLVRISQIVLFLASLLSVFASGGRFEVKSLKEKIMETSLKMHIQEIESRCEGKSPCVEKIPLRDFFRNPELSRFNLSPDARHLAYMAPVKSRMNIFVMKREDLKESFFQNIDKGKVKQLTSVTQRDIAGYFWKGNENIVYVRDFGGDENFHLFSVNILSGEEIDLTPFEGVKTQVIDDLEDHEEEMLIGMNKRSKEVFDVYRVNIKTGQMEMIAENPGNVMGWMTDHDGKLRVASTTDGVNTTLLYRDNEEQEFRPVITTNFKESVSPLFFTFDNKKLYSSSNLGRDKSAIVLFNPETAKEEEVLFEHPVVDVSTLTYSRKNKKLISIIYTREKRRRKFLDQDWEAMYSRLENRFPDLEVGIFGQDKEEEIFLVRTYSDRSLGKSWIYEKSTDQLKELYDHSEWLDSSKMAPMIPIEYTARDGRTIPGYLTLPLKSKLKDLPVIINPHGGPWARDNWGFNSEVQFFANRGYAVLQMNFRGSVGYGRDFWESSFKKWGLEMQDDITDGVQWLIDQGIAEKDRIGIYGASYGGYAVLAGLAFTPDLYACGVDYVGVSNLFTLLETIPPYWKPMLDMMYEMIGHPEADKELLKAASPVFHVDKITAPLFIAQGAKDPRVKKSESDQMVEALKKRGVEVPYLVKENEGHGFSNEENRFEFYEKIEPFLAKHLKN